jgi:hypothetical protein
MSRRVWKTMDSYLRRLRAMDVARGRTAAAAILQIFVRIAGAGSALLCAERPAA